jgi:hypothetical protein
MQVQRLFLFRAHARQRMIGGALITPVVALVSNQGMAVITGLASGETAEDGRRFAVVLALLVLYILALIMMAIGGALSE